MSEKVVEYREVYRYNIYPRGDGGLGVGVPRAAGLKAKQRMKCFVVAPGFVVPKAGILYMVEDADAPTPKAKRARQKAS